MAMATSSIFNEVKAKDKKSIRRLIHALEQSKTSKAEDVSMSHPVHALTKEQIQKIFGGSDGGL